MLTVVICQGGRPRIKLCGGRKLEVGGDRSDLAGFEGFLVVSFGWHVRGNGIVYQSKEYFIL